MTNYHWGIVGLGRIAHNFAKFFPAAQTLYGVAARDIDRAQTFADEFKVPKVYASYADLFADPDIDIVYVATTHNFHYANIKAALLAGKHVFAEKSITLNARELSELITIAEQKHLILMEAQTIYHMPLYPALDDAVADLGKLRTIQVSFGINATDPQDRLLNPDLAGGALLDIGIYALSFVRRLMSASPKLVATQMTRSATGVDDQSSFLLTNDHGEQATVVLNLQAMMPKVGLAAYDHGFVQVPEYPRADHATLAITGQELTTISAGDWHHTMAYEILDMAKAVETGDNPTLAWTYDTAVIMSQAREAWGFYYPNEQAPLV